MIHSLHAVAEEGVIRRSGRGDGRRRRSGPDGRAAAGLGADREEPAGSGSDFGADQRWNRRSARHGAGNERRNREAEQDAGRAGDDGGQNERAHGEGAEENARDAGEDARRRQVLHGHGADFYHRGGRHAHCEISSISECLRTNSPIALENAPAVLEVHRRAMNDPHLRLDQRPAPLAPLRHSFAQQFVLFLRPATSLPAALRRDAQLHRRVRRFLSTLHRETRSKHVLQRFRDAGARAAKRRRVGVLDYRSMGRQTVLAGLEVMLQDMGDSYRSEKGEKPTSWALS